MARSTGKGGERREKEGKKGRWEKLLISLHLLYSAMVIVHQHNIEVVHKWDFSFRFFQLGRDGHREHPPDYCADGYWIGELHVLR